MFIINRFMELNVAAKILVAIMLFLFAYAVTKIIANIFDYMDVKKDVKTILWLSEGRYCTIITSKVNDKAKVITEVANHVDDNKKDKPAAYIALSKRRLDNFREAIEHCRLVLKKRKYNVIWTLEMGDPVIVLSPTEHEWED